MDRLKKMPITLGGKIKMKKHNNGLLGKHWKLSKETKERQGIAKLENKNPMWKGNNVGYIALHNWIESRKPKPKLCERCKINKPYDLANISGKYKRDINDFEWLCRSCHMKIDYKNGIRKGKGKI